MLPEADRIDVPFEQVLEGRFIFESTLYSYLKELPYCVAEGLPRLKRLRLRAATTRQRTILL